MKIAVTSPSFSTHPDLILEMEKNFNNFKLNTDGCRFSESELIDYLRGFDAAIVGLDEMNKNVIDALPELKFISKYGVGLNNIDLEHCKIKDVQIGWTGGVNKLSVAEMVIGNTLSLLRNLYTTSNLLKNGEWKKNGGQQLSGKKVGIIGVGHIGKEVIRLLEPFKCELLVNDVLEQESYYSNVGARHCTKDEIYKTADVITIHSPFNVSTENLINAQSLAMMQKHTVLINSARGGIVNETSLYEALKNHKIGGAALDVFLEEPPTNLDFLLLPNLICTPHIGGNSKEAVFLMGMSAIGHVLEFAKEK